MVQPLNRLKETASQTAGPYVHIGLTPYFAEITGVYDADLGIQMVNEKTKGERIVVTGRIFDGTGTPGWRAEIVSVANQQGSGNPLAVAGQGILQVMIDGSAMPFETGIEPYSGPNPLEVENPVVVTEVRDAGVFEGTAQTLIGLSDRDVSYRVFTLTEPTRLVVDIAP